MRVETMDEFLDLSVGMDIFCFHETNIDVSRLSDVQFYHETPTSTWVARTVSFQLPTGTAVYMDA